MKFELKVLRSCSDEAIEMPGQLDEVVALFGCLSEWGKQGRDKKITKKIFNHRQRQQQDPLAGIPLL